MKIRKLVFLNLLTLAVSITPTAFATEGKNSQSSKISKTQFTLEVPLQSDAYKISADFGVRMNPEVKENAVHNGIDYEAPKGTAILAANDGVVIFAGGAKGYGETIIIKHNSEFSTLYAHILPGSYLVKMGETVKKGQKIADIGAAGSPETQGDHLHFSVMKQGEAVNPCDYLKKEMK